MGFVRKISIVFILVSALACSLASAQGILDRVKKAVTDNQKEKDVDSADKRDIDLSGLSNGDVSGALKEALNVGVKEGVQKLGAEDGFFKNDLVKILLPEQLRKVDATLRSIGLGSLADQGLLLLNRAAEDAVQEGVPIFANAITAMTFDDAKNILLGDSVAATNYLKDKTADQLFTAFKPKVEGSLGKVGANKIWEQIISKYNGITNQSIETDLNNYVTQETIGGVYRMVAEKERAIRDNSVFRTTSLLKNVFGKLD